MKKILSFLSLLALVGAMLPNGAASAAIKDNGATWWSVSEMLDFARQVEIEKESLCHEDYQCAEDYIFSKMEENEKYRALENFLQTQIWLTSVNPQQETIKVLFFDEDVMLKRMGIHEKINLEELYFGWFDDWKDQIYNYDHDRFANGEVEGGVHNMYDGNPMTNGENWLPAWREVEISVAGSDLMRNTSGKIGYAAFADTYNAQGYFDYSACLKAEDYQAGSECKLMFSANQWASYFPPRTEVNPDPDTSVVQEPTNSTTQHDPNEPSAPNQEIINHGETNHGHDATPGPEPETDHATPSVSRGENLIALTSLQSAPGNYLDISNLWSRTPAVLYGRQQMPVATIAQDIPTLPSEQTEQANSNREVEQVTSEPILSSGNNINLPTAGRIAGNCKNYVSFPWWLMILLVIGDALLLWLFWPRRKEEK